MMKSIEQTPYEVCKEMQKLRDYLDKRGIPWLDVSDEGSFWMCRTRFNVDSKPVSVINGIGSYGGYNLMSMKNDGLLEAWSSLLGDDVTGHLTADELIKSLFGGKKR